MKSLAELIKHSKPFFSPSYLSQKCQFQDSRFWSTYWKSSSWCVRSVIKECWKLVRGDVYHKFDWPTYSDFEVVKTVSAFLAKLCSKFVCDAGLKLKFLSLLSYRGVLKKAKGCNYFAALFVVKMLFNFISYFSLRVIVMYAYVQVKMNTQDHLKSHLILDYWIVFEEFALKLKFFSLFRQRELDTFVSWTSINSCDVV